MQDFRNLEVWQKAHQLTLAIYQHTESFPSEEQYGLTSQLRRSGSSIPANLAEGCGRGSDADFARFVQMAIGSANEVDYHLLLARDLGYLSDEEYETCKERTNRVLRMLHGLLKRLRADG
jgi:four helix bundle protein